jgi:serine phosphatase RsbU (regulator of sigma subunit)
VRRQVEIYKDEYEELRKQLNSAKGSYEHLVNVKPSDYKVKIAYKYQPFAELGGDFCEVRNTDVGVDILVADVAGHDMGASYHTILIKALFDEAQRNGYDGVTMFELINSNLLANTESDRMATALFLRINLQEMTAETVNAAHPSMIYMNSQLPFPRPIKTRGLALGVYENVQFEKRIVPIKPKDRLFIHTDGLTNVYQTNGRTGIRKKLNEAGLDDLIKGYVEFPLGLMVDNVWQGVTRFCHYKYPDDMLLLGIEIPNGD